MVLDPAKPFDITCKVDASYDGMRLDKFVAATAPRISRTKIKEYNKQNRITVNDNIRPDSWRVKNGDIVVLRCRIPKGGEDLGRNIPVDIVYEDDDILGVNKQAGLVVHPVALHRHNTLLNALYWRYKDKLPSHQQITLVNRIDRYTSGVVLVSKNMDAKRILQKQFEARTVSKSYLALVLGNIEKDRGEINLPIGQKLNRTNRTMMGIRKDGAGKKSKTFYVVKERFCDYTLVQLLPKTGRQHQLRVHMSAIGHPLVADHLYGDNHGLVFYKDSLGSPVNELMRFALHAENLTFCHPVNGQEMTINAPPPDDFSSAVEGLRKGLTVKKGKLNILEEVEQEEETRDLQKIYGNTEFDKL